MHLCFWYLKEQEPSNVAMSLKYKGQVSVHRSGPYSLVVLLREKSTGVTILTNHLITRMTWERAKIP